MEGLEGYRLEDLFTDIFASKERIMPNDMFKMGGTVRVVFSRPKMASILRRKVGKALLYHFDGARLQVIRILRCRSPRGLIPSQSIFERGMIPIVAFALTHQMRTRAL